MIWLNRAELVFAPLAIILVCVLAYQVFRGPKPAATTVTAAAPVTPITVPTAIVVAPVKPPVAIRAAPIQPVSLSPIQAAQPLPVVIGRLVKLWDPNFRMTGIETICRTLRKQQLECFKDNGDWTELVALNHPAILTLQAADGVEHHVLLRQLNATDAILDTATGPQKFPLTTLAPLWNGEYLLLWRRQMEGLNIGPTTQGESVQWLRRRLAAATGKKSNSDSPRFDNALRDEIVNFQALHQLEKTGAAGPRTLIALGDGGKDSPALSGKQP